MNNTGRLLIRDDGVMVSLTNSCTIVIWVDGGFSDEVSTHNSKYWNRYHWEEVI